MMFVRPECLRTWPTGFLSNTMFELLTSTRLTWNAFLDIFIVAFLIYQILVFIKGTRAVQMVVGLGLIVAFYYFARWAQLETVT